jgi:AcrR family transcriptional regulator
MRATVAPAAPAVRTRLPREERRAQILGAAALAFRSGGFDGTSMDDVAKAAGVTRLIVYRIFESKDELYRAVLEAVIADLAESFAGEPAARLQRDGGFARQLLGVARRHPDGFRLLWRHAAHEPEFAPLADLFRTYAVEYAESLLAKEIHDQTMLHWSARAVLGYLYDGICTWLDDGDPTRDGEFVELLGVGSRALVAALSGR